MLLHCTIHPARGTLPCREPPRASNARPYNRWKNAAGHKGLFPRKPGGYGIRPYKRPQPFKKAAACHFIKIVPKAHHI